METLLLFVNAAVCIVLLRFAGADALIIWVLGFLFGVACATLAD